MQIYLCTISEPCRLAQPEWQRQNLQSVEGKHYAKHTSVCFQDLAALLDVATEHQGVG